MSIHPAANQRQSQSIDEPSGPRFKRRLRLELSISGRQEKAIAIDMHVDPAQLTRWLGDNYRDQLPAYKLADWTNAVSCGLWRWLEADQPTIEPDAPNGMDIGTLVAMLASSNGTTLATLIQDLKDNIWSGVERQEALPGIRKLEHIVVEIRKQAETEVAP